MPYTLTLRPTWENSRKVLGCDDELAWTDRGGCHLSFLGFVLFFSIPFIIFALVVLPPLSVVVTLIRGHVVGSSPLSPTTVRALHFCREKDSALSSPVDPDRVVPTHVELRKTILMHKYEPSPILLCTIRWVC